MKDVLKDLSREQIAFICSECSITEETLRAMDDDDLYDTVYEKVCDIEIEEVCSNDGESETKRCELASDIVTLMGNMLARDEEGTV